MENEKVRIMFDRIARRYDLLNHLLSGGIDFLWRKKLVHGVARAVQTTENPRLLDVASGTADVAIALAHRIPHAEITGIDLSDGMLDVGRRKVARRGLAVKLQVDNGEQLSFADRSFDAVTIAFGIRNFSDRQQGLREFARVLRDGGTLHILELSTPRRGFFAWVYRLYSHHILPFVGGIISGNCRAYAYLPASVDAFPAPDQFLEQMRRAGFSDCTAQRLTGGIAYIYNGELRIENYFSFIKNKGNLLVAFILNSQFSILQDSLFEH